MLPATLLSVALLGPLAQPRLDSSPLPPVDFSGVRAGRVVDTEPVPNATDLYGAIHQGDVDFIRRVVKASRGVLKRPVGECKGGDESPLLLAADRHKDGVIKVLLELGADVNWTGPNSGRTPLMAAAVSGPSSTADILLKAGAKLDPFSAAALGKTAELRAMIDEAKRQGKQADFVNASDGQGWAGWVLLNWAVYAGQYRTAELLLERGANPNPYPDECLAHQYSPLQTAVRERRWAMIPLLLRHGANPELRNGDGLTPLHAAIDQYDGPDLMAVALLVLGGAKHTGKSDWHAPRVCDITVRNVVSGWDPSRGFSEVVEEPTSRETGLTPLHVAAGVGYTRVALLMLALGVDANPLARSGGTPLDVAILSGKCESAWLLRQFGGRTGGECHARGELLAERIRRPAWVPLRAGDPPAELALPAWMHPELMPELLRVVGSRWKSVGWQRPIWYRDADPSTGWQVATLHKPLRDAENPPAWMGMNRSIK